MKKKRTLLLLMVLATSTAALGSSKVCIDVSPDCPRCDEAVTLRVTAWVPGACEENCDVQICKRGNIIYVDICCHIDDCDGCKPICIEEDVNSLCPGLYVVVARVYCKRPDCGCPDCQCPPWNTFNTPILCGIGSTHFNVLCANPCWPWWPFGDNIR